MDEPREEPISHEARNWGMACHLTALAAFAIPYIGHLLGPLVVWLIKRNEFAFVDDQGKESLNFQLSITIYALILVFIGFGVLFVFCGLQAPFMHHMPRFPLLFIPFGCLLFALAIFDLILVIIASVNAANGTAFRYPLRIRFVH